MNFLDKISDDEMQLMLKEWPLTGGTAIGGTSKVVAFLVKLVRNEGEYLVCGGRLYGKDGDKWVRTGAVVIKDGCMSFAPGKMCPLRSQCMAKDQEYGYITDEDR